MSKKKGKDAKGKGANDPFEKEIETLEAIEDEDGIKKNAVVFNLEFEIEHIDIQDYIIQLNFIDKADPSKVTKFETPLIDQWDEKEDPSQEGEEKKPKKDKKGKGKGKKAAGAEDDEPSGPVVVVYS